MLARSPTVQGLAETLAAIPPVDPQRQDAISPAPFTASQRAAGVPCAAMQEGAARSYLVMIRPSYLAPFPPHTISSSSLSAHTKRMHETAWMAFHIMSTP